MQKGFMYINENIKLDFEMREELQHYIDSMDEAFEENDEIKWDYYHEVIGAFAKNEWACGYITTKQRDAIWERYSTAG